MVSRRYIFTLALLTLSPVGVTCAAEQTGHQPEVKVSAPTRLDWVFALSNQSPKEPPVDWLLGYDSTAQSYELFVPRSYNRAKPAGLILFISPGDKATGLNSFRQICDEAGLIFASPHKAGNSVDTRERVRIVLDVLDDVRQQYAIDADRTYIGGFSGGGRIACAIGFSLPEYFGGVIPVCASGDLREESWLRRRVTDRLSVAHLTGESDFNRGEIERFRGAMLASVGVRNKVWVAPKTGHAVPAAPLVGEAVRWLDEGLPTRRKVAQEYPASRIAGDAAPSREAWAKMLLAEGKQRLADKPQVYAGLMQMKGVLDRWPDLAAADEAKKLLLSVEGGADRSWEADDIAEQRKFLIARARALSDYASGDLPQQYLRQRPDMATAAIELWNLVIQDGQDQAAVAEGKKRLPELTKLAGDKP